MTLAGEAPLLTVSDFVAIFNQTLSIAYPEVYINGEISNYRVSKNAWVYFDLKDEFASVKFFGSVRSLPGPLEDGMLATVVGQPYLHPLYGFSIQVRAVVPTGEGSLSKAFQLLYRRLDAEGIFDKSRKRPLPFAPQSIGLIASKESAGYGDFNKIISRRWPMLLIEHFDVLVQGSDAAKQLIAAIEEANQRSDIDVIVIVRGGGSRDDLAAFDHEQVVRSIAASRTPTLVAIGHERDEVLAELAADMRASTPSNAAELLVPDCVVERQYVAVRKSQLNKALLSYGEAIGQEIENYTGVLNQHVLNHIESNNRTLHFARKLLFAVNPKKPLEKGYALVRSDKGKLLRSASQVRSEEVVTLEFSDDIISVTPQKEEG